MSSAWKLEKGVIGGEYSSGYGMAFSLSLFRQLSEQYSTELLGTIICFSQVVQYCKKLVAIESSSSKSSSLYWAAFGPALLAAWEWVRLDEEAGLEVRM
jgi:hypothetical protein